MSNDKENLTDHEYDGIEEFDNPLPVWWLATFFATIIFGFLYWIHYEFGGAPTQRDELKADLAAIHSLHKHDESQDKEETLAALVNSEPDLAKGKQVYLAKCAVCHGNELQGLIGPNLTDEYWIHGAKLTDIAGVIRKGVLDKGMPNWDTQLSNEEIRAVTVFVFSARGSNPANPKAPQGEKVARQ